jgi:hypothetical protein
VAGLPEEEGKYGHDHDDPKRVYVHHWPRRVTAAESRAAMLKPQLRGTSTGRIRGAAYLPDMPP